MINLSLGKKKKVVIAVFAFLLLTPLIVFYSSSDNSFDTRSSAGSISVLPSDIQPADLDADGEVTVSDYEILMNAYRNFVSQSSYLKIYDLNNDGSMNFFDIVAWQNMYEKYKIWVNNQENVAGVITYNGEEVSNLLLKEKTAQLGTTFRDSANVTWTSNNTFAVTVDSKGKIQLVGEPGEKAYIYARNSSGTEARVLVTIDGEPSGEITYEGKVVGKSGNRKMTLEEDSSVQLGTTYSNCTKLTWTSRNESVVSVDQNGRLLVKGKEGKKAYVYAMCDSKRTPQVRITVTKKTSTDSLTLNKTSGTIYLNSINPKVSLKATNTTNEAITWSSSDTNVATVNSNGKVTAKAVGRSKITAKAGNLTATYNLTVKQKIIIIVGASQVVRMRRDVTSYESDKYKYQTSDNTLKIIGKSGSQFDYQLSGGAGYNSMYEFISGYSSVKKYIEFFVYFPIAGNGIKLITCKNMTEKNKDILGYMENYSSSMASITNESYNVKTYLVSVHPVDPKQCKEDCTYVVESDNTNACSQYYRSNVKYYTYNKLMEKLLKNYGNLTYVETFTKIIDVNESRNVYSFKNGISYITEKDGIHWMPETTVYYVGLMLGSNTDI